MDMETKINHINDNVARVGNDLLKVKGNVDTLDTILRQVLHNQNTLLANQKLILDELRKK